MLRFVLQYGCNKQGDPIGLAFAEIDADRKNLVNGKAKTRLDTRHTYGKILS